MYLAYAQHHTYRVPTLTSSMEIFPFVVPEAPNTSIAVSAVWDTGATRTFINSRLSAKLNLIPIEFQPVVSATGNQMAGLVDISLKLPNGLYIPDKRAFMCPLPESVDILIGMDIIQLGDFHISNAGGKTLFSFVIPSLPNPFNLVTEAEALNN